MTVLGTLLTTVTPTSLEPGLRRLLKKYEHKQAGNYLKYAISTCANIIRASSLKDMTAKDFYLALNYIMHHRAQAVNTTAKGSRSNARLNKNKK